MIDSSGGGDVLEASLGGSLIDLIESIFDPNAISSSPRDISVTDLGTTEGGIVTVEGLIFSDAESSSLQIVILNLQAEGFGGTSVVYQGLDAAIATARALNLNEIVIQGSLANPQLHRFLMTIPGRIGYDTEHYTTNSWDTYKIFLDNL